MKLETQAIHSGYSPDPTTKAVAVSIYQTTSYAFDDTKHGADLFDLKVEGNIYSRIMNPTNGALEQRVAEMEGGIAGLAVASGMAAITYAIQCITRVGDNIVTTSQLYGGTYNLFAHALPNMGIEVRFASGDDPAAIEALIDDNTKAVYAETVGNPNGNVVDIEAFATIAHRHGVPLIVDSGNFPWADYAKKFPMLTEPDPSYHGVVYTEALGAALSPMNAFLLMQGIETVPLRMARHGENAIALAEHLKAHPGVTWVKYASLPDSPYYPLVQKYMGGNNAGGILSFGIKGGEEAGAKFIDALQLIVRLVNIGDAKSLACHPATTTHRQLNDEELASAGVSRDMVRISVGIEHIDDILADVDQALAAAGR